MRTCASTRRSVYLHNNKLADAGLPDNMFNGSSNVEVLILSSNFLRHVPKHLPPALYKLHLKVGRGGVRRGTADPTARALGQGPAGEELRPTWAQVPTWVPSWWFPRLLSTPHPEALTLPSVLLTLSSLPFIPQNNKLEKIPPGAFSELSSLRELYLQNNYLTDEGLDNETFW